MGRRDRERRDRIQAGMEDPMIGQVLRNPVARRVLATASKGAVVRELSRGTTSDQVERLGEMMMSGELPSNKLRDALTRKAPKEMDRAIRKFRRRGKEITVDSLCSEIQSTPGFLLMCERAGLTLEWFENLAKERMDANAARGER